MNASRLNVRCATISFAPSVTNSTIFERHANRCRKLISVGSSGATHVKYPRAGISLHHAILFAERGEYWQARAQQDANFRAQLEDYQQQQVANTQRNEELRLRYNDLLADENYKAQNCRLCPNCQRVVQHLGGCNAMICGQNYHGGDVQSGCGHKFDWSQATPYAPIGNTGPEQVRNDMPAPEQQQAVVHEGVQ